MLSPPKPLDNIQPNLVCDLLTWMGRITSNFFDPAPWGPGEGPKVKYYLVSITKSISKIFIPNFVCILTNKRYKRYQTGFALCRLGNAPGVGHWGVGVPRGSKKNQTWSCGISNPRGWRAEQNASKIFIVGSNWWPWVRSKGQISLNFDYHVNSKIFIPNFVCVLTNKILKTYWTEFRFCCWGHDPGVGLGGAGWVKNFSVGICDGASSTAHSSSNLFSMYRGETKVWH